MIVYTLTCRPRHLFIEVAEPSEQLQTFSVCKYGHSHDTEDSIGNQLPSDVSFSDR